MKKRVRIKDIAALAGVSAGTVDRVLHNRGNVSEEARKSIEDALRKVDYKPNIHISGLSLRRTYEIVVTTPNASEGEYWAQIHNGIKMAEKHHESINIKVTFLTYDQYNIYSCQDVFTQVLLLSPDAVIIGPTYTDETRDLARLLNEKNIPFVLLDSYVDGCSPLAYYTANHFTCGYLICKLLMSLIPKSAEIAVLQPIRIGDQSSNTGMLRRNGALKYLSEHYLAEKMHTLPFSISEINDNEIVVKDFFKKYADVKGIAVLNSRGNEVADLLRKCNIYDVKIVSLDLTETNVEALKNDSISFLIDQNPEYQAYMAMKTLLEYLVLKQQPQVVNYMPLNIVTKETVDLHLDFNLLNRI